MKKEKESSQGLESVLVPILTGKEHEDFFIEKIKDYGKIVLLFVVDEKLREVPAGFVGSRIKSAENEIEKVKFELPKTVLIKDYVEWGSWPEKVENTARLEECGKIVMARCKEAEQMRPFLKSVGLSFEVVSSVDNS